MLDDSPPLFGPRTFWTFVGAMVKKGPLPPPNVGKMARTFVVLWESHPTFPKNCRLP